MKTLKRSLSLVLALVLALSLCSVAFASNMDDYSDADKVTYTEAVDVLLGIKIVDGIGGKLEPTGGYTRAQGAALIARLVLGRTAADKLTAGSAVFTDVPADHWAAGAIAFGVSQGYINGMGDGTFNPDGPLTGYAVAKMVLNALGYGAKGEFTGENWQIEVAKLALNKDIALFKGNLSADFTKAATREEAMLYVFNSLLVPKVQWSALLGEYTYGGIMGVATYGYLADVFDLSKDTVTENGINGHKWFTGRTYNGLILTKEGTAVSDFYSDETVKTVVSNGTKVSDLADPTKSSYIADLAATVTYVYNGVEVTATTSPGADLGALYVNGKILMRDLTTDAEYSVVGAALNVYLTDGKISKIAIIEKIVDTVGTDGTTVTEVPNRPSNVEVDLVGGTNITGNVNNVDGYDGLKKDDVILYYTLGTGSDAVTYIEKASSIVAQLTATKTVNGVDNYTVGGNVYVASTLAGAAGPGVTAADYNKDTTFYFDNFGNIVKAVLVEEAAAAKTYGLVVGYEYYKGTFGSGAYSKVQLATADGTVAVYDALTKNGNPEDLAYTANTLVEYVMNDSKVITKITAVTDTSAVDEASDYTAKSNKITLDAGTFYMNSNTVAFFYAGVFNKYDASTAAVKVVTGYSNMPTIADDVAVSYVKNANTPNIIDILFVNAAAGTVSSSTKLMYIADNIPSISYETVNGTSGVPVYTYSVYIDGALTTVKSTVDATASVGLFEYTEADGYVDIGTGKTLIDEAVTIFDSSYYVADGVTYNVNSSTAYYVVDATKKTVTKTDAPVAVSGKATKITYVAAGNTATDPVLAIYYTVS